MLSLSYSCGLRAGEVVRLKVKHIDSAQEIQNVAQRMLLIKGMSRRGRIGTWDRTGPR
jgi:integrase